MNKSKTTEMDIEQITQEDQDIMSWEEVAKAINSSAYTVQEAATRVSPINKPPILPRMKHRVWPVEGVRYLGKLIKYDETFEIWSIAEPEINLSLCGGFFDVTDLKKKILMEYKPRKTLKWLEQLTDLDWYFEDYLLITRLTGEQMWGMEYTVVTYNIKTQVYQTEDIQTGCRDWQCITPREFVEKIAAGEWI